MAKYLTINDAARAIIEANGSYDPELYPYSSDVEITLKQLGVLLGVNESDFEGVQGLADTLYVLLSNVTSSEPDNESEPSEPSEPTVPDPVVN